MPEPPTSSTSVGVEAPPPLPQASKINECFFRTSSARLDNVCMRVLEDGAIRLQNDPRAACGQAATVKQNHRVDIVWVPESATH